MSKIHTKEEKREICKRALKAEKEGTKLFKFSKSLDITDVTLYDWVKKYELGMFDPEPEIPASLISVMSEELNTIGSVKIEMVDVLVYVDSVSNHIFVSVEKPDIKDIEGFSLELERRVLKKMSWCFAAKGFKFQEGS